MGRTTSHHPSDDSSHHPSDSSPDVSEERSEEPPVQERRDPRMSDFERQARLLQIQMSIMNQNAMAHNEWDPE